MNWIAHGFLIISKFFMGYGAGFAAVLGFGSTVNQTEITIFNLAIYPCLAGLTMVFPQLTKTFAEASRDRMK